MKTPLKIRMEAFHYFIKLILNKIKILIVCKKNIWLRKKFTNFMLKLRNAEFKINIYFFQQFYFLSIS